MTDVYSDKLLNTREAAGRLGLSASTLAKLRLTGAGPRYRKLMRAVRYAEGDLRRWADDRIRASTSDLGGSHAA